MGSHTNWYDELRLLPKFNVMLLRNEGGLNGLTTHRRDRRPVETGAALLKRRRFSPLAVTG
jgi:hypothetical protein